MHTNYTYSLIIIRLGYNNIKFILIQFVFQTPGSLVQTLLVILNCEPFTSNRTMRSLATFVSFQLRDFASHVPLSLAERQAKLAANRSEANNGTRRFHDKMSVVLYGIDSTSLNQGYRSLPRTLGYLKQKMESITFKGYEESYIVQK